MYLQRVCNKFMQLTQIYNIIMILVIMLSLCLAWQKQILIGDEAYEEDIVQHEKDMTFHCQFTSPLSVYRVLVVLPQSKQRIRLLSRNEPPSSKDDLDSYSQEDRSGNLLQKHYYHIELTNLNEAYVLILAESVPVLYKLTIQKIGPQDCLFNCTFRGQCRVFVTFNQESACVCDLGFIDEDCSVSSPVIEPGIPTEIRRPDYVTFNRVAEAKIWKIEITVHYTTNQTNSIYGLTLYCLYRTDLVPLPSSQYYDYVFSLSSERELKIFFQLQTREYKQFLLFFKQQVPSDRSDVKILITAYTPKRENYDTVIIIACSTIAATLVFTLIIMYFCWRRRKSRQNEQEQHLKDRMGLFQVVEAGDQPCGEGCEECPICLQKLNNGKEVRKTKCSHRFHTECLKSWVVHRTTCPNCRQSFF